jgi:glycosyltransferase involved in cell wall biosynthesis
MTQNSVSETSRCIKRALPYVDHIIIVDGGSIDSSILYFRNWESIEPKLHFYLYPWKDNFSEQRNNYLKEAARFAKMGDIILTSDPDELFEEEAFQKMYTLGERLNNSQYNAASFQCRSVSIKGEKRVYENMDDYWKPLMYKWHPEMRYHGNPHETLSMPIPVLVASTNLIYEHIKQENGIWPKGMRNYIVGGGGPNLSNKNKYWLKLREIMKDLDLNNWHSFNEYLLKGNIDRRLKDEFEKYITLTEIFPGHTDGLSEMRECFKTYYFIYHPEELPEYLKDVSIP